MGDELWGCNGSAFELLLWVQGEYDWWFDVTYKWAPYHILRIREELRHTTPPFSESDIDTLYPLGAGRWRRTWRWSFGRPKGCELMWPKEKGTPAGNTYSNYQDDVPGMAHTPMRFYGIYRHSLPFVSLTEEEQEYLRRRHDRPYESIGDMIMCMWDMLARLRYLGNSNLNITLQSRFGYNQIVGSTDTTSIIWSAVAAAAEAACESASWSDAGGTPPAAYVGWHGGVGTANGLGQRGGDCVFEQTRIKISNSGGMIGTGIYSASNLAIRLCGVSYVYDGNYINTEYEVSDISLELPDGEDLLVGDEVGQTEGSKRYYYYVGLGEAESNYTENDIYREIINNSSAPTIGNYDGNTSVIVSRKHLFEYHSALGPEVTFYIDWGVVPSSVFNTERNWQFNEIAVDDEKFDDYGKLILS